LPSAFMLGLKEDDIIDIQQKIEVTVEPDIVATSADDKI
jgi:hypothetical protein